MLLPLLLLPGLVTAYTCNYLDPKHRQTAHLNWKQLQVLLTKEECQTQNDSHALYGCVTRVDRGELRMGCYNGENDIRPLCRQAIWNWHKKCDYEERTPMGSTHSRPGYGACCCVGQLCNELPPYWLLSLSPKEYDIPTWRRDVDSLCMILMTITGFTILSILGAVLHHFLHKFIKWISPQPKQKLIQQASNERPFFNFLDHETPDETTKNNKPSEEKEHGSDVLQIRSTPKTTIMEKSTQRTGKKLKTPERKTATPQKTMIQPSLTKMKSTARMKSDRTQGSIMTNMKTLEVTDKTQKE